MAAAIAAVISFGFSSCAYDPYYSSAGGYYGSGYGDGYGYGSSNFSTSFFVSTGDPRWGYDPYCHSYYDYRTRRYYDPYLYGYYPVGYRPVIVVGAPHPHGWRPGRGYCPPPSRVRNVTVKNYRHRETAYRNSNYSWAKQVRVRPNSQTRTRSQSPSRSSSYREPATSSRTSPYRGSRSSSTRSNYQPRNSSYSGSRSPSTRSSSGSRQQTGTYPSQNRIRSTQPRNVNPDSSQQRSKRIRRDLNTPVAGTPSRQIDSRQRNSASRNPSRQSTQPSSRGRATRGDSQHARPSYQRGEQRNSREPSNEDSGRKRSIRSLGQG